MNLNDQLKAAKMTIAQSALLPVQQKKVGYL
jgi:hypothetical protein